MYPDDKNIEYNIDMCSLHKIKEPLLDLNSMIGMSNLKENIEKYVDKISETKCRGEKYLMTSPAAI